MMKTRASLVLICAAIVALAISASAQSGVEIGIRGGMGMASLSDENVGFVSFIRSADLPEGYSDNYEAKSSTGFQIGGFATFNLGPNFAIQPELIYVKKGGKVEGVGTISSAGITLNYGVDEKIDLSYLEIPVLVKFRIPTQGKIKPALYAGPALALNLSATSDFQLTITYDDGSPESQVFGGEADPTNNKSSDFCLVFGGDVKLEAGSANFVLDVRYTMGTSQLFEDVHPDAMPDWNPSEPWPPEFPTANWETGKAPDMKTNVLSITAGVTVPI